MAVRNRRTDRARKDGLSRRRGVVALLTGGPGAEGPNRTDAHLVGRQPASPRGLDGRTCQIHREHAPRPRLRGAGPAPAPHHRMRCRAASFPMGRSRRASAGRDQPPGRHRFAYPHGPRTADGHPVHLADVRLPSAVPWLRVQSAVPRRRHGRNRQPGSARRGAPCRAPESAGPRARRLPSDGVGISWCASLAADGRRVDRDRRHPGERTVRSGRRGPGAPVVRQRLDAAKPLRGVEAAKGGTAKPLADAAVALAREAPAPATCLVFGNTPKTARETFDRLCKALPEAEVLLLTGCVREREAERIRARILDPEGGMATARRTDAARRRHLIVVATQTLEVGPTSTRNTW